MGEWQDMTRDRVPVHCSPDCFDRETGYVDKATEKRVSDLRQPIHGDVPGHDRGAERLNAPGPR
jgi:hypothetical protein